MENIEVFVRTKAAQLAAQQYQNNFRPVVAKQAGVQEVMASIVERLKALPPEQQRLLLGAGGGAAVGGLSGAVGAIRNRGANRSMIGDSLRGALAGGAVGGGGALAYNAVSGGHTGLGGNAFRISDGSGGGVGLTDAVDALDAARAEGGGGGVGRAVSTAANFAGNHTLGTGGFLAGGAMDIHDRLGEGPRARRTLENLRRMATSTDKHLHPKIQNLKQLVAELDGNKGAIPKVMGLADLHSTNTGSLSDRFAKWRAGVSQSSGMNPGIRPTSGKPDAAFSAVDKMFRSRPGGRPTFDWTGKFTADDLRDAVRGTGAAAPQPPKDFTGNVTNRWAKLPGRRAITGGAAGLAASYAPSLINYVVPSAGLSDQQTGQVLRDIGAID